MDRPLGSLGSAKTFFPFRNRDILVCMPEPLMPKMGLGMKVAWSPFFWARVFTASLKVMMLSAVVRASAYLKSISC